MLKWNEMKWNVELINREAREAKVSILWSFMSDRECLFMLFPGARRQSLSLTSNRRMWQTTDELQLGWSSSHDQLISDRESRHFWLSRESHVDHKSMMGLDIKNKIENWWCSNLCVNLWISWEIEIKFSLHHHHHHLTYLFTCCLLVLLLCFFFIYFWSHTYSSYIFALQFLLSLTVIFSWFLFLPLFGRFYDFFLFKIFLTLKFASHLKISLFLT